MFNLPTSFACTACGLIIQQVQFWQIAVFFGPLFLLFELGKKYCNSWENIIADIRSK